MVLERFDSGFAILQYDTWRQCSVQQFLLFKLCNSIPDRRPLVKQNAIILDFRMIYRMAQKYVPTVYKNTFEFKKKNKKEHTYGILSTGTYYKQESNQRVCPSNNEYNNYFLLRFINYFQNPEIP